MSRFGEYSRKRLSECHLDLRRLFNGVIQHYNCAVLVGYRRQIDQDRAFYEGRSLLKYPQSKHNKEPSQAADIVPWFEHSPHIRWNDKERFYCFGGYVLGVAAEMGISIRWGGDWDQDGELHDQTFFDLSHFELGVT